MVNSPAPAAPKKAAGAERLEMELAHKALLDGDYAKARALAEPLAKKNDAAANHLLGYLYEKGLGVRADIGAALRHYGDAAIAGNSDAQLALGVLAFEGDGVYPDYERAAGWFRLAAAQGDPRADVRMGLLYAEGLGVAQSSVAAAHHFAKAAGRGDAEGQFWLGLSWLNGDGLPQSYQKAATNFESAARQGHGEAAYHLGLMYESPVLGAPDVNKAVLYMRAAAEAGFPAAYAAMGLMVHRGDAEGRAADWFEKGAHEGDAQSAFLYAVALYEGDGRAKDILGALTILDQLIASKTASEPLKAQAAALEKSIRAKTPGPLTLRN
ncbi:MAG: tetratricopeptide repeat protein [Pseudomonadota bacterium]